MTYEKHREVVLKYFRNGCLTRTDKLIGIFFPELPFRLNAKKVGEGFSSSEKTINVYSPVPIAIDPYKGTNKTALKIADYLKPKIDKDVIGLYLHGSIGTMEEISYSDFDGLVIVKDEVFADVKRLCKLGIHLRNAHQYMTEMDPLQHHGWFILTEKDLAEYPEYYFPHQLLSYSKSLFGQCSLQLYLKTDGYKIELENSFLKLANGILLKLESKSFLGNYYRLKNFLSECMLLPAFFLGARNGTGIFKKYSFAALKNEIGNHSSILDDISEIRTQWKYNSPKLYLNLLKHQSFLRNVISISRFSGKLPPSIVSKFDERFISGMTELVYFLKNQLRR